MKPTLKDIRTRLSAVKLGKVSIALTCLGTILTCATSCGILGDKKEKATSMSQSDTACLDELGPLTEDFLDGKVSEAKWASTWDCVDDTIDLFKKYVQGSDSTGYSVTDLQFLMQKFMFSRKQVTTGLVESSLSVKASLFGGSATRLSKDELDSFRALARFIKTETVALIPHMKNRKENPTTANLRAFADAVDTFGQHFATYLKADPNPTLTIDRAVQFVTELAAVSNANTDPAKIEQWTRLILQTKILLVRGDTGGVGGKDWTKLFKLGFRAGGAFMAYLDLPTEDPLFEIEMAERVRAILDSSVTDWNGVIPFTQMSKIVDLIPADLLPGLPENFRAGVKAAMLPRSVTVDGKTTVNRPGLSRLLQAKSDLGMDAQSVTSLMNAFRLGMRATNHLNGIFVSQKEDLSPTMFETRAKAYITSAKLDATGQSDVNRLITIAKRYLGYFPGGTPEMLFLGQDRHSNNNLRRMSWGEIGASLLMEAYGSSSNVYGKAGKVEDIDLLIADLNPLLYSLHMLHPAKTGVGAKRFREANLFTQAGNGDDLMDIPESTIYLSFLFSATNQSSRIMDFTFNGGSPCPIVGWNVPLKLKAYDIACFRSRFTANFNDIFMNMPHLQDDYAAMNAADKDTFNQTLEMAAKNTGFDPGPISEFDIGSYAGVSHFVESAMKKFDVNGDNTLDRSETLDVVFPVFKRELATMSKIKIDFVNKAVLLYLMQYGKEPEIKDLLKWAISFEFLKKFNAHRIRVYQIFAALSPPAPADEISQTPPPGAVVDSTPLGFIADSIVKGLTVTQATEPTRAPASVPSVVSIAESVLGTPFDLSKVDPVQLQGYPAAGPVIDPTSKYKEALDVLPQDL